MINHGWSVAMRENAFEGRAILRKGLELYAAGGCRLLVNRYWSMLADVQAAVGLLDHAVEAIEEALHAAPEQKIDEPTLLWRRRELLLEKSAQSTNGYDAMRLERAERDFREAIAKARAMGAKLYELRPAISLARTLKARRNQAGRELLQPLYDFVGPLRRLLRLEGSGHPAQGPGVLKWGFQACGGRRSNHGENHEPQDPVHHD